MFNAIVEIQYVDVNNCFLHLSSNVFNKLKSFSSRCVKGVVTNSHSVVYFTTNATACHWLARDAVGISSVYASLLHISPGDKIVLTPLDSSPSLRKVTAYPISEDDHQILEIASDEVETTLLNQLKIVWPKQCFPVWVSPSIVAKLVVDSVTPAIDYGNLVEDTEIVIGEVKTYNRLVNIVSENNLPDTNDTSNQNVSSCSDSSSKIDCLYESIVCRLVPQNNFSSPYHVSLTINECPEWIKKYDASTVFQLRGCIDPYSKVFVNVSTETNSIQDISPYKSLTVSNCVFYHLSLGSGSKVLLSHVNQSSNELSSLLITPCPHLKKKMSFNEIENLFRKTLSNICLKWGRCLLNANGMFLLDENASVTVTLRPLNLEWAFVTLISLYNLPISVNTVETSSSSLKNDQESINKVNSSSFFSKSISSDISSLLEHSLGLKEGLKSIPYFKNNFLLVGKHGCGKTHISNHFLNVISKFPYYIHYETIDCISLKGKRIENTGKIISSLLNLCRQKQPAVLLMENIEIVCGTFSPELEKAEASFHIQRVSQKVADILEAFTLDSSILVFATCENISSINSALFKRRGHSVFSTVIPIQPLTLEERQSLMENTVIDKTLNTVNSLKDLDLGYYASLTESYVSADLIRFIEKAIFEATQRYNSLHNELVLTRNDLKIAFESSSSFMNNKLKVQKHYDVRLSDIGGLKKVKEKLLEIVIWPSKYGSLLNQCPLKKQTGVLLYGAPGSGKTMLARAIAHESNLNFITVKGPELMSKYIGESEEGVRRVFENAQAAKPSLLFFDEFESLAPRRGEEQTGVTDRVVNQLLTALDGVEPISGVIVVAASSRPDLIDPALLRPGRLSHHLFCSFPDSDERCEILSYLTGSVNLAEDVDLKSIAQLTDDFSGADLKGLLTTAQIQVLDELEDCLPENGTKVSVERKNREVKITQADLLAALRQSKPSLSTKDRLNFTSLYNMFSKGKVVDITNQRAIFA